MPEKNTIILLKPEQLCLMFLDLRTLFNLWISHVVFSHAGSFPPSLSLPHSLTHYHFLFRFVETAVCIRTTDTPLPADDRSTMSGQTIIYLYIDKVLLNKIEKNWFNFLLFCNFSSAFTYQGVIILRIFFFFS